MVMNFRRAGRTLAVTGLLSGAVCGNDAWGQAISPPRTQAQTPATQPAEAKPAEAKPADAKTIEGIDTSKLPVSLDRIRQSLQHESKLTLQAIDPTLPVFRTSVQQTPLKLEDYWKIGPDTAVPDYVRPFFASQLHYDFLRMTAKENVATDPFGAFGNPLQPVGPPVLPIVNGIKKGLSNIKRGRIKRQIEAELKAIEGNAGSSNHAAPEDSEKESQPEDAKEPTPSKPRVPDVPR